MRIEKIKFVKLKIPEDLPKALVPYKKLIRNKKRKLQINLEIIGYKRSKLLGKGSNIFNSVKAEMGCNKYDKSMIEKIKHNRLKVREDLSKALVPYKVEKEKIFNKAKKRKRKK